MVKYKLHALVMYSYEIEYSQRKNKRFRGVYSLNNIPLISNGDLVINLDTYNLPGKHWVSMIIMDNVIFYFDSLKLPMKQLLINYIVKLNKTHLYINSEELQKPTETNCGYFVLSFLNNHTQFNYNKIF